MSWLGRTVLGLAACLLAVCPLAASAAADRRPVVCHRAGHHHRAICRSARRRSKAAITAPPAVAGSLAAPPSGVPLAPTNTAPPRPPSAAAPVAPAVAVVGLPSRLLVEEREYGVVPGHNPVAAGTVTFNASNIGMDDHNLTISLDGVQIAQTPVLHPGDPATTITAQLRPGSYKVYCSLYDHDQLGMHATLVVR